MATGHSVPRQGAVRITWQCKSLQKSFCLPRHVSFGGLTVSYADNNRALTTTETGQVRFTTKYDIIVRRLWGSLLSNSIPPARIYFYVRTICSQISVFVVRFNVVCTRSTMFLRSLATSVTPLHFSLTSTFSRAYRGKLTCLMLYI